ncbi:GIY-YIG nuclease family protein [Methanobacterium sp.]|uniref:GIY-YIG nuclease family protein n=1 Tax=Methanobacterium sp. TaxID=2164 RepID=UPI002ABB3D11|nr:GIY-YIG nuclease family protein [Methanobacterium sp.]MDY9923563.1 GIY-YIG nuclease family protein [Methanobacterium sp.]
MVTKTILKGTYCLLINLNKNQSIEIGKKGEIQFKKGCYVYVGSALNSLEGRIKRHLRQNKKMHWHVDYLLDSPHTQVTEVFYSDDGVKHECELAVQVALKRAEIKGFGCSDCKCQAHLFYFQNESQATLNCLDGFKKLKLEVKTLEDLNP